MSWFENNPLGVGLASFCALMALASAILWLAWNRPVSTGSGLAAADVPGAETRGDNAADMGPFGRYRIVTDRPLFNESRRPVVDIEDGGGLAGNAAQAAADAPDLTLTGVVITPEMKLVSLTPAGGGEPEIFHEGLPMKGAYRGWLVSRIGPRRVSLESVDGERVDLDLVVHDQKITEPPRPQPAAAPGEEPADEDQGEGVSRAEEIRQRIAERREQLRQEAAGQNEQQTSTARSDYQAAIQAMINSGNKKDENENGD